MATWQIVMGTVGFGACLIALWVVALLLAAHALEGDDAETTPATDLRLAEPSRTPAGSRLRWDRPVALSQVQQDLAARLADRKREASEAKVHQICRAVRDGGRHPSA